MNYEQSTQFLPGDPQLVDHIVGELKFQGIFDQFRRECISDVDTKPAYQNLRQRVEGNVSGFLNKQKWSSDLNKNHLREMLRRNIQESGYLETGVERIVDQVVNPKINTVFYSQVEDVVYKYLGISKPEKSKSPKYSLTINTLDLLPTDLDPISPASDKSHNKSATKLEESVESEKLDDSFKMDEDESPPFEPLDDTKDFVMQQDENSMDSNLSGFSDLTSHHSNHSCENFKVQPPDVSNQDSQLSRVSSNSRLSIITSDSKCENSAKLSEEDNALQIDENPNSQSLEIKEEDGVKSDDSDNAVNGNDKVEFSEIKQELVDTKEKLQNDAPSENIENNLLVSCHVENKTSNEYPKESLNNYEKIEKSNECAEKENDVEINTEDLNTNPEKNCEESIDKISEKIDEQCKEKESDKSNKKTDDTDKTNKKADEKYNSKHDSRRSEKKKYRDDKERKNDKKNKDRRSSNSRDHDKNRDKHESRTSRDENKRSSDAYKSEKDQSKDRKNEKSRHERSKSNDHKSKSRDKDKKSNDKEYKSKEEKSKDKESSSKKYRDDKYHSSSSKYNSKKDYGEKNDKVKSKDLSKCLSEHKSKTGESKTKSEESSDNKDTSKYKKESEGKKEDSSKSNSHKSSRNNKESKKEIKDDHFSSKEKNSDDRRSTDRDSNDGGTSTQKQNPSGSSQYQSSTKSSNETSPIISGSSRSGDSSSQSDHLMFVDLFQTKLDEANEIMKSPKKISHTEKIEQDHFTNLLIPSPENITDKTSDDECTMKDTIVNSTQKRSISETDVTDEPTSFNEKNEISISIKKPRFASNIFEARKLMKIRKKMHKMEQRKLEEKHLKETQIYKDNNTDSSLVEINIPNIVEEINKSEKSTQPDKCESADTTITDETNKDENSTINKEEVPETLSVSVISKERWDAIEAKLNQSNLLNIDYESYGYDNETTPTKSPSKIIYSDDEEDCLYFNPKSSPATERYLKRIATLQKLGPDVSVSKMLLEVEKNQATDTKVDRRSRKPNTKYLADFDIETEDIIETKPETKLSKSPNKKKNIDIDNSENISNDNNNVKTDIHLKKIANEKSTISSVSPLSSNNDLTKQRLAIKPVRSATKNRKKKKSEQTTTALDTSLNESFFLPPSPESDVSASSADLKTTANKRKISDPEVVIPKQNKPERATRSSKTATQRYSSDDLYKPRPLFASSRRSRGLSSNSTTLK